MKYIRCILLFMAIFAGADVMAQDDNVVDEVIWVVGDEPILKSDV